MGPIVLALLATAPGELLADEPSPGEVSVAREQFNQGVAAAKEDRWEDACDAFARAYALSHQPSILFNLAGAQMKTSRWVEARETYRRFLREDGDAQRAAQQEARRLLAALEPRIPRLTISMVDPMPGEEALLDGDAVPAAALGLELPVDPGPHLVVRVRGGIEIGRAQLELREGEHRAVALPPPPSPPPPPSLPPPPPVEAQVPIADAPTAASFFSGPWFWVALGVVVAGGVAAGVALASRDRTIYPGTTGVVLRGLDP